MKKIFAAAVLMLPSLAFAQSGTVTDANSLSTRVVGLINLVVYVLIALAVLFIIYNVVMYMIKGNDPAGKSAALANVGWGVLGLAIILSIWGLVNILTNTFKTTAPTNSIPQANPLAPPTANPTLPTVN